MKRFVVGAERGQSTLFRNASMTSLTRAILFALSTLSSMRSI
jgi:hypothetical protein